MRRLIIPALAALFLGACATVSVPAPAPREGPVSAQQAWDDGQQAYLHWNASRRGWRVTESGIQAKRISKRGSGPRPQADDTVKIHYVGTLINGTKFDSSRDDGGQPIEFPLPRLIRGWQEAVPMMRKGETWRFVIPANLAYGPRATGPIPGNSALIFEIELFDFKD